MPGNIALLCLALPTRAKFLDGSWDLSYITLDFLSWLGSQHGGLLSNTAHTRSKPARSKGFCALFTLSPHRFHIAKQQLYIHPQTIRSFPLRISSRGRCSASAAVCIFRGRLFVAQCISLMLCVYTFASLIYNSTYPSEACGSFSTPHIF